ncbi:hypothetical protein GCM10008986_25180 [Salinibacillus aidingensis]|uniref:Uncharacterized protein n=1 Tax=Salinibacillus aidingensis TaxID=237684 RepID=A0ABN1BGG0_9BACI
MRISLLKKSKSYSYPISYGVNMADGWSERVHTLIGEVSSSMPKAYSYVSLGKEKSAEAVVVKTSIES